MALPFKRGHDPRRAKGGRRNPPGGRPTRKELEQRKILAEALKRELQEKAASVAAVYYALATGTPMPRGYNRKNVDRATTRHYIERFVPPATKRIEVADMRTIETFYEEMMREEDERKQKLLEDKTGEVVPPKEQQH